MAGNDQATLTTAAQRDRRFPRAPDFRELPLPRSRVFFNGNLSPTREISLTLKAVTPILGGSYKLRHIDDVDIIRPQSVRAHLRFWWRALYAHKFGSAAELYAAESALWGRAADEKGGRSAVEIRVNVVEKGEEDSSGIELYGRNETPGAYALWPAKEQREDRKRNRPRIPTALRRVGTGFRVTLVAPEDSLPTLHNVLRAWILFGGYGSRTRRGLGSLTVEGSDAASWLPATDLKAPNGARLSLNKALRESLGQLFRTDVFEQTPGGPRETPVLADAILHVLPPIAGAEEDAEEAWTTALGWLREFRQGPPGGQNGSARQKGRGHPGISNWPEADKIRHHAPPTGTAWPHDPSRHNSVAALPRALGSGCQSLENSWTPAIRGISRSVGRSG